MMWGWEGGPGYGFLWGFGGMLHVLLIVGFVFLMVRLFRRPRTDYALSLLRQRYAKGEITKEDFDRIRADLKDQT